MTAGTIERRQAPGRAVAGAQPLPAPAPADDSPRPLAALLELLRDWRREPPAIGCGGCNYLYGSAACLMVCGPPELDWGARR